MSNTVLINDVPLSAKLVKWPFIPGPVAPEIKIVVSNITSDALDGLKNPVTLSLTVNRYHGGKTETESPKIEGLYLTKKQPVSAFETMWTLTDRRWLYAGLRVSGHFCIPRRVDESKIPAFAGIQKLEDHNKIAQYKYRANTLQDGIGSYKFFRAQPSAALAGTAAVWTALDGVLWLLDHHCFEGVPGVAQIAPLFTISPRVKDLGRVLFDERVDEEPFLQVLARFCALNHCAYTVDHKGFFKVYPLEEEPIPADIGGYSGAGFAAKQERKREVPFSAIYRFPKRYEVELIHSTRSTSTGLDEELALVPVVQLPDSIDVPALGGKRFRGDWVSQVHALEAWNAQGWKSGKTLTMRLLAELGTSTVLLHDFAIDPQNRTGYDQVQIMRLSAISGAWRRYWRISPMLMNVVEDWAPELVGFVDPETGASQPSAIWQDFAIQPTGQGPVGTSAISKGNATNVEFPNNPSDENVAPAHLSVIDRALGIFRVDFFFDPTLRVAQYLPSRVVDPPQVGIASGMFEEGSAFVFEFTILVKLSVVFSQPNSSARYLAVYDEASKHKLTATEKEKQIHFLFTKEFARYEWIHNQTFFDVAAGRDLVVRDAVLLNGDMLISIARAEMFRYFFSMADRVVGFLKRTTYDPVVDELRGNTTAVVLEYNAETGVFEVAYHMDEAPDPLDKYLLLPRDAKQRLYRELLKVSPI